MPFLWGYTANPRQEGRRSKWKFLDHGVHCDLMVEVTFRCHNAENTPARYLIRIFDLFAPERRRK